MLVEIAFIIVQATASVFVACEVGQRLSNAYSEIADVFDQLNWYLLPIEVRRILPTIILYVQQPIEIMFFGSLSLNRAQFKRVSNTITTFASIRNASTS